MRKQFINSVTELLASDTSRVLLLGDIGVFGFRQASARFPYQVYNVGILEQATVGMAAGLAMTGMKPIVHTIAPFLVERAYEQLKVDFGYQRLAGTFVSVGGSYDYSSLGCTHHCPSDVNLIENIPGFKIFVPGHPDELAMIMHETKSWNDPIYIRLAEKSNSQPIADSIHRPTLVRPNLTESGDGPAVLAVGPCLDMVLAATVGLPVAVFYTIAVRPFPYHELRLQLKNTNVIVVEPYYSSQLSRRIEECNVGVRTRSFSHPRRFVEEYGNANSVNDVTGFSADALRVEIANGQYH